MHEVWLEGSERPLCRVDNYDYLNYDKLIYLSRTEGKDILITDEGTGEIVLRIGKGWALGHNS